MRTSLIAAGVRAHVEATSASAANGHQRIELEDHGKDVACSPSESRFVPDAPRRHVRRGEGAIRVALRHAGHAALMNQ